MSYLKKRYGFSESTVLSPDRDERSGLPDAERVALPPGLIVLSEQLGQHIDMPIFLYFFYLKLGGEGPNSLSICAALNQSAKLSTNAEQNNSINVLRAAGKNLNLLLSAKSFRAVGYWPSKQKNQEASPSQQQHKLQPEPILEGIPLPFIEVPYTHILEGCIRLLYSEPTDPLWASYPTVDMGKMKVAAPTAEQLAEKERKRKEKKAARKASGSGPNKQSEPTPGGTITVQPKDLRVAAAADKSSPHKKQRHSSLSAATKEHAREDIAMKRAGAQAQQAVPHDVVKVESAFKKKAAAHSSVVATNKIMEADILQFKQAAIDANARGKARKMVRSHRNFTKGEAGIPRRISHAYLRAQKEMILKFKAGQTSWPTPEPSEDEGDDGETSEISSNESESEHVGQPEVPPVVQEGSSYPTRDSFIEAMEAARTDIPEPNSNMEEVMSVPQPSQENHP
ncbi:hypothetical protein FNV43_RR27168 [Rhamnella rubrinervis]|uniref:Uncharacterized protein n=1 Tax=Rhamnella rubrinervis TaxID=2594499 RepID=A0A8K0DNY1_9ROSA|nr:hypothetical protein FNV43_RR27168 [Rhamnella rubrinervis]